MMNDSLNAIREILSSLGLVALLVLAYSFLLRWKTQGIVRQILVGMLFSVGVVIALYSPHEIAPGVIVDSRSVILGLAAPFGGPLAAILATVSAVTVRLWIGGAGAVAGVVGIVVAAGMGAIFCRFVCKGCTSISPLRLLVLGVMVATQVFSLFLLPWSIAWPAFTTIGPVVILINILGILLLGSFLANERERVLDEDVLREQAETDPLTGLANRRTFEGAAERVLAQARETGTPLAVLAVDCDHFKAVNDTYGHDVGDQVLVALAKVMKACVRGDDVVARFGGEEFVMLLPGVGADVAGALAERVRRETAETAIITKHGRVRVTVSIGLADWRPSRPSLDAMLRDADRALYCAKQAGRDQVVQARPEGESCLAI